MTTDELDLTSIFKRAHERREELNKMLVDNPDFKRTITNKAATTEATTSTAVSQQISKQNETAEIRPI